MVSRALVGTTGGSGERRSVLVENRGSRQSVRRARKPLAELLEKIAANELVLVTTGANDWLASNGSMTRVAGGYPLPEKRQLLFSGRLAVGLSPVEDRRRSREQIRTR